MRSTTQILTLALALAAIGTTKTRAQSVIKVGTPAPAFTALDTRGRTQSLTAYRGKWVVLEWFNHECPYTKKQYGTDNMQALQREYTKRGVTWLSIVSSAPGKEGFTSAERATVLTTEKKASPTAVIRDTAGILGHLYGARNTPQLIVIDPQGILQYDGAIDDKPTTDPADVPRAKNYLRAALDAGMSGKTIATPTTQPYGCTVQY
jgi:peroxiredoxin